MFYQRHPSAFMVSLLFVCAAGALMIPLALLPAERVFGNTDALFYAILLKMNGGQFLSGDLWPRWLMGANSGIGFPLMYYYPPLPYLLTTVVALPLKWLSFSLSSQLFLGLAASQFVAGLTAWYWLKRRFSARAAVLGALFYVVVPYKFILLYLHVNLAHAWALAWLPLIMLACDGLVRGQRRSIAGFAIACALVAYSHPLTLLAFAPVPVLYVLWNGGMRVLPVLMLAALTALLIMASYIVAFVGAKGWLAADAFTSGKFNVRDNLGHIDTLLSAYYIFIAGFTAIILYRLKRSVRADERLLVPFWSGILVLFFLLTLSLSAPVWEHVPGLKVFQFPFARLQGVMALAATWLIAWYVERAGNAAVPAYARPVFIVLILMAGLAATGLHIRNVYSQPSRITPGYVQEMQHYNIIPYEGYHRNPHLSAAQYYHLRQILRDQPNASLQNGTVKQTCWQPGKLCIEANVTADKSRLFVRQYHVPGWKAVDVTTGKEIPVSADAGVGIIMLVLDKGTHNIKLTLAHVPGQRVADLVSLLTLLACVGMLLRKSRYGHAP